jgi:diaminohydroxyphosphoribosylaminopyrimidine deaminase/5-amino-6-(5-phosphoribosylamino)uracil reductase
VSRPSVTLKIATSMDGRIALSNGVSQWITGSESRARVHRMRAEHDAVLVGVGTVLADDPLLTARTIPLPAKQPVRIVADSSLRTPLESRLVNSSGLGRVVLAAATEGARSSERYSDQAEVWQVSGHDGRVDPKRLIDRCAVEGINSIFLEGGGKLAASFVKAGLVNVIQWFRAPILIGGDGLPAIAALGLTEMANAPRWKSVSAERIGDDVLETYTVLTD